MRATGIIRRIDDLHRVVIPKEICRSMGIREGDPLEIFTTADGCVALKRYTPSLVTDMKAIQQKCTDIVWGTHPHKAQELNELFEKIINIVEQSEDDDDELKLP